MPTNVPALTAADVPLCPSCLAAEGLCTSCGRSVLPQLKQPSWHQLVHRGEHHVAGVNAPVSPEGEKVRLRKQRKAVRRLARAIAGEHTRSVKAAA